MIYPTLEVSQNNLTINFVDTEFENNPFLSMGNNMDNEGTFSIFMNLLTAFLNQYNCGYDDAIDDGAFGDEDIFC